MALELPERFNIAQWFIDRPAEEHPSRIAILGEPRAVRYDELAREVNRAGNALRGSGCRPGDRVLIVLPDSLEFVAAFFGAAKIGAVPVPVNAATRAADYAAYLAQAGARIVLASVTSLKELLPAVYSHPPELLVVAGGPPPEDAASGMTSWEEWLEGASARLEAHPTAATDTAFMLCTSGSGGQPKGVLHQHKDMLVSTRSYAHGVLGLRLDDRTFSVSKLFFAYGLGNGMYFPFSVGASTVLLAARPRPDTVAEVLARHRPTIFFAVPTFYAALLRDVERGLHADFSSVRQAVSAGEVLPAEIFERFRRRFGVEILDGIGSTEMLQMFLSNRSGQARAGTCGVEVPNYEARIADEVGRPLPAGEIGNLWVKGQSAFAGYWNLPELTARTKQGEWVATGDKFFQDADGYYHYCGRSDDMLKVQGLWVSPGEVENALLGHPAVAEAAVVGKQVDGLTRPVAFVVLRPGVERPPELPAQLTDFVRTRLASYKAPQEIHFLDELPKTATGKIQRFKLRS